MKVKFRQSTVKGKEGVLLIQVIGNRKMKLITTRLRIFPEEWDEENKTIKPHVADKEREIYLCEIRFALEGELKKLAGVIGFLDKKGDYTVNELAACYADRSMHGNLFPYMDRWIQKLRNERRVATATIYLVVKKSFHNFRMGSDVMITAMDTGLIRQYETYLKNGGVSMNSISCYMRTLRSVYNKAVDDGLTPQRQPFKNVYTGICKTEKRAVDEMLIIRLKRLNFDEMKELSFARDLFLFSFYTRGMSFVDMVNLTYNHIQAGYLFYTRSKTGQHLSIKMEPCMEEIIARYRHETRGNLLLPILRHSGTNIPSNALRTYNKRLERISAIMNLEKPLTSYVSRHTWATIALRKGIPLQVISEGMGHENENTTRIYLASLEQSILDQANAQIISL
ncbi:MAG: site-specific integrase [Tannerellaceae bacterium]|jgi:site-specific recombinase XerD|nr:site-specific integrase [Tannerellaceae bacterium]